MVGRRAYKRVKINAVDVDSLLQTAKDKKIASLGLDIGKDEIVACLRWGIDDFERPWSVSNPLEVGKLVQICQKLVRRRLKLTIGMESTGTYGDSVRLALTKADLPVVRISGQRVRDHAEVFDGVPSQHDGKDAAVIAELCEMGKGVPWPYKPLSDELAEIEHHVRRMDTFYREQVQWSGRLESMLARHWPELSRLVKPTGVSMLSVLLKYGGPDVIAASVGVTEEIMAWSKGKISEAKASSILHSARGTLGIPMTKHDKLWMQEISQRILDAKRSVSACTKKIRVILEKDPFWSKYLCPVGAGTLGVILSTLGDPRNYDSAGALLKACGLNLAELSSGKRIGEKGISKRGPALTRRWLYFWAMRSVQKTELKEWYHRFHSPGYGHHDRPIKNRKIKGIICMMRKLLKSLWSSMHQDQPFEYSKVIAKPAKPKRRRRRKTKQS